jgi:CRISPR/Cas system-associated endonuclease/helicase Cas3
MIDFENKPKNILIMGHKVKISYRKKPKNLGEFYADDNLIIVSNDDRWKHHLLHEILHAILFHSGHSQKFDEKEEEALVRALESGLTTLSFF